jgi:hypothetical protein
MSLLMVHTVYLLKSSSKVLLLIFILKCKESSIKTKKMNKNMSLNHIIQSLYKLMLKFMTFSFNSKKLKP